MTTPAEFANGPFFQTLAREAQQAFRIAQYVAANGGSIENAVFQLRNLGVLQGTGATGWNATRLYNGLIAVSDAMIKTGVRNAAAEAVVAQGLDVAVAAGAGTGAGTAAGVTLRTVLARVLPWVGVVVVLGLGAYGLSEWAGRRAADDSVQLGPRATGERTNSVNAPPAAHTASDFELLRTEITKQVAGESETTSVANGYQPSLTLQVDRPGYTATVTFTADAPPTIGGSDEEFTVTTQVESTWNLMTATHNLNVATGALGGGSHKALPPSGEGTLEPGSHSLSASYTASGSLDSFGAPLVRGWEENGVPYRSISATFSSGVVQDLSGGTLVFVYSATG